MATTEPTPENDTDDAPPTNYTREDSCHGPRWVHEETGLQVGLIRDRRPTGRRMDAATAMQSDDDCWMLDVRTGPGEFAAVYRRLDGDKQGSIRYAREWMHDHPCGKLDEGDA